MLHFYRAGFRSGIMKISWVVGGVAGTMGLRANVNDTDIDFGSEEIADAVLLKYPSFFTEIV